MGVALAVFPNRKKKGRSCLLSWNEHFLAEHFRLTSELRADTLLSMKASDLVKPENMDQLVSLYAPLIKANDSKPVGTYIGGWLGGVALGLQYMQSVWNVSLHLSLDQLTVQLYVADDYAQFSFVVDEWNKVEAPETGRAAWLDQQYRAFYQHSLQPLIQSLAKATDNPEKLIWGQLPTRFNYYLDYFVEQSQDERVRQHLRDDYDSLCRQLEGACFGLDKNPFDVKVRWVEDMRDPSKKVRLKNQCCLYYQTGEGQYCYTCPRLKEDARAVRRQAALQA